MKRKPILILLVGLCLSSITSSCEKESPYDETTNQESIIIDGSKYDQAYIDDLFVRLKGIDLDDWVFDPENLSYSSKYYGGSIKVEYLLKNTREK